MFADATRTLLVSVPVALLTAVIMYWRVSGANRSPVLSYAIGAIIFGFVARWVYGWMVSRWPATGDGLYLGLALGLAVALTVLAVVGRRLWNTGDVLGFTLINFLWAIAFGWVLPRLLA